MAENEWDDYAGGWDENPQTALYASKAFAELEKILQIQDLRVFDFGCGTGLLTEKLAPQTREIVALDGSAKMIDVLDRKALSNVYTIPTFLTQELLETDASLNKKFDLIIASSVCAFVPDYPETLRVLKSMLLEGGYFVQWDWLVQEEGEPSGFSLSQLENELDNAGFKNVQLTTPFGLEDMTVVMAVAQN